jgi:flagellar basal-body rod modification protein FlgD
METTTQNLGQNDFLALLVAQVQNQDPLNPVSDTDFIAQLAQFNQLNGINTLNASFEQMLTLQKLSSGTNLVGKTVQYRSGNDVLSGKVSQVIADGNNVSLKVGNSLISLDDVTGVTA